MLLPKPSAYLPNDLSSGSSDAGGDGKMDICVNEECDRHNTKLDGNCEIHNGTKLCKFFKPLMPQKAPVAEVPCSAGLCTLRPNGEPHPAMTSIYAYVDEIEDKEPVRADSICSLAMQFEEKLWEMAVGA